MTTTIPSGESDAVRTKDLGTLYARHWSMVVGYLRGQGARDPEDLAGDVFVGVIRNLDRFEGDDAAFRSWLLVIAHRRLVDRRPVGDVEEEAVANLATARVLRALERLTDEQRTVVLLHEIGDLSLPQIAEAMGKRLAAVKSLHHRGLAAAARALGDEAVHAETEAG